MDLKKSYQIRKAAGLYWLLDMEQSGIDRQEPVALNESGAYIWQQYERLGSDAAVAEELSEKFEIPAEEALADVKQFLKQLERQGMVL